MWKGKRVSVIFSTYNEKNSIKLCINNLFNTKVVDEIIAVDNNAALGTREEILKCESSGVLKIRTSNEADFRAATLRNEDRRCHH